LSRGVDRIFFLRGIKKRDGSISISLRPLVVLDTGLDVADNPAQAVENRLQNYAPSLPDW
jgi:hypothetical protein